jgi:hypothetical protein
MPDQTFSYEAWLALPSATRCSLTNVQKDLQAHPKFKKLRRKFDDFKFPPSGETIHVMLTFVKNHWTTKLQDSIAADLGITLLPNTNSFTGRHIDPKSLWQKFQTLQPQN